MSSNKIPKVKDVKKIIESITSEKSSIAESIAESVAESISVSATATASTSSIPVKTLKFKGKGKGKATLSKVTISNDVSTDKKGFVESLRTVIINKIMTVVHHPKFKWIVAALLLCGLVFAYFKYQQYIKNKKLKLNKAIANEVKSTLPQSQQSQPQSHQSHQSHQSQQSQQQMQMQRQLIEEEARKQFEAQLIQQQYLQMQNLQQKEHMEKPVKNNKKTVKINPPVDSTTEEDTEEVFIEDQNVMNHNLTMDEMNAIDKQLEDVNIDNIINSD